MKFLTIYKNHNGSYTIKDSVTDIMITYYNYSLSNAIKKHREKMNIKYKHFNKIILEG